jgi:hypothetical protein
LGEVLVRVPRNSASIQKQTLVKATIHEPNAILMNLVSAKTVAQAKEWIKNQNGDPKT